MMSRSGQEETFLGGWSVCYSDTLGVVNSGDCLVEEMENQSTALTGLGIGISAVFPVVGGGGEQYAWLVLTRLHNPYSFTSIILYRHLSSRLVPIHQSIINKHYYISMIKGG